MISEMGMRQGLSLLALVGLLTGVAGGCGSPAKPVAAHGPSYYGPIAAPNPVSLFGPPGPYARPVTALPGSGHNATGAVFLPGMHGGTTWQGWWLSVTYGALLTQPGTAAGHGMMTAFSPPFTAGGSVTWFVPGRRAPLVRANPVELATEVAWWDLNQPLLSPKAYSRYIGHVRGAVTSGVLAELAKQPPALGTAQLVGAWTDPAEPHTLYTQWHMFGYVQGANEAWQMSRLWLREDLTHDTHGWKVSRVGVVTKATPGYSPGADWNSAYFGGTGTP